MDQVPKFSLRSKQQQNLLGWLILVFPVALFYSFFWLFESFYNILNPGVHVDINQLFAPVFFWCIPFPIMYFAFLAHVLSDRLLIKQGKIHFGFLGIQSFRLASLKEVSGDGGSLDDNFKESLVLSFENGQNLYVDVDNYEDEDIRTFLAVLKKSNPSCSFTYSEVIPLESRGLLKFLISTAPIESMIIELSKSPVIDLIVQLVKQNEQRFFKSYVGISLTLIAVLSFFAYSNHISESQSRRNHGAIAAIGPDAVMRDKDIKITEQQIVDLRKTIADNSMGHKDSLVMQAQLLEAEFHLFTLGSIDYWLYSGSQTSAIIWLGLAISVLLMRVAGMASPKFLFVDNQTIGMANSFHRFENLTSVSLRKTGEMSDPLDGFLDIQTLETLKIDLSRIPELQKRHLLLRLVDRYAGKALRNDEFLRTTNAIVDIQFTDLWLQSNDNQGTVQDTQKENTGKILNEKYKITSILGYGGQGTTYMAQREFGDASEASELLVIKESVLPTQADVRIMLDSIQRFKRGAELLIKLDHPQIVKLIDDFVENDRAYLVMEYIRGETLRQLVRKAGAFREERVIEFGIELCNIIEYLHTRDPKIIHCDLAPDNLILTPEDRLTLVDFDVARAVDGESHNLIAGRPSYTPPEQFRGKPIIQSDIFALGGIMYFLLNGTDPPPLGAGFDEFSDEQEHKLASLIHRCLAFEIEDRPASACELRQSLENLRANDAGVNVKIDKDEKETVPKVNKLDRSK